jgi:hypothetical protein
MRVSQVMAAGSGAPLIAQVVDLRPGQWQWTITMSGGLPPGVDVSKLPPEVAAKMSDEAAKPMTVTDCITAEEVRKGWDGSMDDEDECKVTSRKLTGTTLDVTRVCAGDRPRTESVHFEIQSRESLRGSVTATRGAP